VSSVLAYLLVTMPWHWLLCSPQNLTTATNIATTVAADDDDGAATAAAWLELLLLLG
jgi:hypothetical protein